ncbi:MAG: hypothetical protein ACYC1Z_03510 [Georgenia sp.]
MTLTPVPTPPPPSSSRVVSRQRRFRIADPSGRSDVVFGTAYGINTDDGCERLIILDGQEVVAEYSSQGWASIMPLPDRGGDGAR